MFSEGGSSLVGNLLKVVGFGISKLLSESSDTSSELLLLLSSDPSPIMLGAVLLNMVPLATNSSLDGLGEGEDIIGNGDCEDSSEISIL